MDFLSQFQTQAKGITTFVTTLTQIDTGSENHTTNPWKVLQDADRQSNEMKQKHNKT